MPGGSFLLTGSHQPFSQIEGSFTTPLCGRFKEAGRILSRPSGVKIYENHKYADVKSNRLNLQKTALQISVIINDSS